MRCFALTTALLLALMGAQPTSPAGGSWVLTFEDDFPGSTLNASVRLPWSFRARRRTKMSAAFTPPIPTLPFDQNWNVAVNRTQDAGHSVFVPSAVSVADGSLVITATHEPFPVGNGTRNFTSGWIDSRNKHLQRGGRWEVRAKLPPTAATCSWPAFCEPPRAARAAVASRRSNLPSPSPLARVDAGLLPNPDALCWPIGAEVGSYKSLRATTTRRIHPLTQYPAALTDIMEYVAGFHMQHNASEPSAIDYGLHYGYQCYSDASIHAGTGGTYPNVTDPSAPVIDFNADFHIFGAVLNDTAITVREFLPRAGGLARSRSLRLSASSLPPVLC